MVQWIPFGVSSIFFVIGLAVIYDSFRKYKMKSLVENTPTSKIRSAAMGEVEIKGDVVPANRVLESPFSNEECVVYNYKVERYDPEDKGSNWTTLVHDAVHVPFYVDDGTGKALVEPTGADLNMEKKKQVVVPHGEEPPAPIREFIQENENLDSATKNIDFKVFEYSTGEKRRYTERYISPEGDAYIFGKATNELQTENEKLQEAVDGSNLVVKEADSEFIISDFSEKEITSKSGKRSIRFIPAGLLMSLFGFFGIVLSILELCALLKMAYGVRIIEIY